MVINLGSFYIGKKNHKMFITYRHVFNQVYEFTLLQLNQIKCKRFASNTYIYIYTTKSLVLL